MTGKPHHRGSSSLAAEDLNLLHKQAKGSPDGCAAASSGAGERRGSQLGRQWKCRLLGSLQGALLRPCRRARCVVCVQVQHVAGLPPAAEGREVVVGWRSKGGEGEHTAPSRVARGAATFDEVFLQHFGAGGATMRSFTVWAALADSECGDLGAFPVDLAEVAAAESSSNPRFGGKAISFPLGGAAAGAVLTVSIYCRVMEQEENRMANGQHARERKNKGKSSYASCLPDLSCLRSRAAAAAAASGSARRATSLRSDRGGFITIENSVAEMDGGGAFERVEDEEGAGFITMEKGTISSRSRGAVPGDEEEEEEEKPCLLMELSEAAAAAAALEVEEVEGEFLAMLEERYEIEKRLDVGVELGVELEALIRDAEMELAKAEQAWKSKLGAAMVEEEEYNQLLSLTRLNHQLSPAAAASSACSWGFGFGSPI